MPMNPETDAKPVLEIIQRLRVSGRQFSGLLSEHKKECSNGCEFCMMLGLAAVHLGMSLALVGADIARLKDGLTIMGDPRFLEELKWITVALGDLAVKREAFMQTPEGEVALKHIEQAMNDVNLGVSLN